MILQQYPVSSHQLTLYYPSVQMFGAGESSVTMKLKGTSRSRLRESEAALLPVPEWSHLYNRVWDVADYGEKGHINGSICLHALWYITATL